MEESKVITMYEMCLLHSRADRVLRTIVSNVLDSFDVTMMEWLLLATVCSQQSVGKDKGMSMTELSNILSVTLPQITALTTGLMSAKLVKQKVNIHDKRSRRLSCTAQGVRLFEKTEVAIQQSMSRLLANIPRKDLEQYSSVVSVIGTRSP